jgi:hypothetical protein
MSDGRDIRFRVIARYPLTVRALGEKAQPGEDAGIEAWFAAQGSER